MVRDESRKTGILPVQQLDLDIRLGRFIEKSLMFSMRYGALKISFQLLKPGNFTRSAVKVRLKNGSLTG